MEWLLFLVPYLALYLAIGFYTAIMLDDSPEPFLLVVILWPLLFLLNLLGFIQEGLEMLGYILRRR